MTANLDKNLSGCEYQLDSMIQGTSGETKERRSEASGSKRSQRVESRKNSK